MGHIRHHAIIVSSWHREHVLIAHRKAERLCGHRVTEVTPEVINGESSFLVAPDGSKEGWVESDRGDAERESLIAWLRKCRKRSIWLTWAEVLFGDDHGTKAHIVRSSDDDPGIDDDDNDEQ